MTVEYTGSIDNLRAYQGPAGKVLRDRYRRRTRWTANWWRAMAMLAAILGGLLLMLIGGLHLLLNQKPIGLAPLGFSVLILLLVGYQLLPQRRRAAQEKKWLEQYDIGSPIRIELDDDGLHYVERTFRRDVAWKAVTDVVETPSLVMIVDRSPITYLAPGTAFTSDDQRKAFSQFIRERIALK